MTVACAQVGCSGPSSGGFSLDIIIDFLTFGIRFGVLAMTPLVAWLVISWLVTDRRRTSSRSDGS
jgi:uncharacterized membrane protein